MLVAYLRTPARTGCFCSLCMYTYMHTYIYIYEGVFRCVHIYIYTQQCLFLVGLHFGLGKKLPYRRPKSVGTSGGSIYIYIYMSIYIYTYIYIYG